jgi:hypothetical protein
MLKALHPKDIFGDGFADVVQDGTIPEGYQESTPSAAYAEAEGLCV